MHDSFYFGRKHELGKLPIKAELAEKVQPQ